MTVNGATAVRTLNNHLFGQNMSVYDSTFLASSTAYVQAVANMGTISMRIPGGGYGSMVDWNNIEAGNYGACGAQTWMISMSEMLSFASAVGPSLEFQPIINYKGLWCPTAGNVTQAVTKAADWVRYLNITAGGARKTTYWEIGNETFYTGDPSYEASGTTYGQNFVLFYNAMKAVDPTIKIGAQCQFDAATWSQQALTAIRAAGVTPDFLIAHAYPIYRATVAEMDQTTVDTEILTTQVDGAATRTTEMNNIVTAAGYTVGSMPYWMTEYRSAVPETKASEWVDTLWSTQYLLELGRLGWQGANMWAIKNGYSTTMQGDYGLLRNGSANPDDTPADSPRPSYYVFPYLSKIFGRNMVSCTDNGTDLRSWASTDTNGDMVVCLVNNNITTADSATINVSGFTPLTGTNQGKIWTLSSAGTTKSGATTPVLQKRWININGTDNPAVGSLPPAAGPVGAGNAVTTGASFTVNVPAASIVLVKIPKSTAPTATVTPYAGSPTFSPTRTNTPVPVCQTVINGLETIGENGTWAGANATRSIVTAAGYPAGIVTQGTSAMRVSITTDSAWNNGLFNLTGFTPSVLGPYAQLKMDLYADASLLTGQGWHGLQLLADCTTCVPAKYSVPLAVADWTLTAGANAVVWDLNIGPAPNTYTARINTTEAVSTLYVVYNHQSAVTGNLYVDNIRISSASCGTATPTPTRTPTPYSGPTCTTLMNGMETMAENGVWGGGNATHVTVTTAAAPAGAVTQGGYGQYVNITVAAAYNNNVLTYYNFSPVNLAQYSQLWLDVYLTPAMAATSTYHQVLLFADCASCSTPKYYQQIAAAQTIVSGANTVKWAINTSLGTILPSDTITGLNIVYVSQGTGTGGLYLDNLRTYLMGNCFTATPTSTISPSATRTPTPSPSPTPTVTMSSTRSATLTPSPLASTLTFTPTATLSSTRSSTPSPTSSPSRTSTSSATATVTVTSSPLANTSTFTPTASPTVTRTVTPSYTLSSTASATPSFTRTSTLTATATATGSVTPSVTLSGTRTASPSATAIFTGTVTPTATPSGTRSGTPSATGTASATPSPSSSYTATRTVSPSSTPSVSSTPSRTATATLSATPSATLSDTRTATSSATRTATPSATPTVTLTSTPTATRTATPSATVTVTPAPTGSSPTNSPTISTTYTTSPTPTFSSTATLTGTRTASPTLTSTGTPSGSPTLTASPSRSATPTFSSTSTLTASPSPTASATRTVTATVTLSASPSRTATATITLSASPTVSLTPILSATPTSTHSSTITPGSTPTWTVSPTVTSSITLSASPSRTGSPSATLSSTPTGSPTGTATATLTFTPTATLTATSSATRSATASNTASSTVTATVTVSATTTTTPSATQSFTPVPTNSTETYTPTASPTATSSRTSTLTASSSPTYSVTPTATPSRTSTPTATSSVTGTSTPSPSSTLSPLATITVSPSASPNATGTPTGTVTPTGTRSATPTATGTASPSLTATSSFTPQATYTGTSTATRTATLTASPTVTPTATPTTTPSVTGTSTPLPTGTLTATPTVTLTYTVTLTPVPTAGPLEIVEFRCVPNPNPRYLAVRLTGPADKCVVSVWTRAMNLAGQAEAYGLKGGWNQVPLAPACGRLSNGTYFITVEAFAGQARSLPVPPGKAAILR